MKYKNLLLDIDDTLFDFAACEREAIKKTFDVLSLPCSDKILGEYHEINKEMWHALERGEYDRLQIRTLRFEILFSRLGIRADADEVNALYGEMLSREHILLPGARSFLREAHKKYRLYVITNGITEVQQRRLDDADLRGFFSGVFISEQIGYNKPDRRFFDTVIDRAGLGREDCIVFGDSPTSDIAGARGAGIDCCLFAPKGAWEGDICPVAHTYGEFLSYLEEKC